MTKIQVFVCLMLAFLFGVGIANNTYIRRIARANELLLQKCNPTLTTTPEATP